MFSRFGTIPAYDGQMDRHMTTEWQHSVDDENSEFVAARNLSKSLCLFRKWIFRYHQEWLHILQELQH